MVERAMLVLIVLLLKSVIVYVLQDNPQTQKYAINKDMNIELLVRIITNSTVELLGVIIIIYMILKT